MKVHLIRAALVLVFIAGGALTDFGALIVS